MDPWDHIAEDRRASADYLATLSPDEWNARSWCDGWTVKDVAAHLLVSPTMSKGQIFFSFLSSVRGCKKRIEGLGLKATDADWSTGDGPLVEGDVPHLLSAMTGRAAALAGLTGDGVEIMASR